MAKNKNCAGTYKVSGYTHDDGCIFGRVMRAQRANP